MSIVVLQQLNTNVKRVQFERNRMIKKINKMEDDLHVVKLLWGRNMLDLDSWHKTRHNFKIKLNAYYCRYNDIVKEYTELKAAIWQHNRGQAVAMQSEHNKSIRAFRDGMRALLNEYGLCVYGGEISLTDGHLITSLDKSDLLRG